MVDKNTIFGGMLTTLGANKKTNCDALGIPWEPKYMLIGDANGTDPVPNPSQTRLVNQVYRAQLNQLRVSEKDANVLIAELVLPPDVGGWWIRELALEDKDGVFCAVSNVAPSYKPLLEQNSGRNQVVRMHIITNGTSNIQLKIDPSVVLATRQYVDDSIKNVLPADKAPGEYTRVKVNNRGVVTSGDNPETLAGMGIKDSYTKTEIESMIAQASALPVGATVAFPLNKVAPGFLELDGSVKSIAVYPDLAAFLGTAFNKGDEGAGNFRLPESRGEFLRGWDHGRGVDAGRAVGTWQADDNKAHNHTTTRQQAFGTQSGAQPAAVVIDNFNLAPGLNFVGGINSSGGTEARPRNLSVVWCIKAWNAPINQGNIDIAALAALATQATENKLGTAKIATQAQTNAGTDDATIVTPKKLRLGFSISLGMSGSVVFPTWLGGIIIQWLAIGTTGQVSQGAAESIASPWPLAFPNSCWFALAGIDQSSVGNGFATCRVDGFNKTTINTSTYAHITGWVGRRILAIGN
ncbi:MAG: phage-related tail fiber protein-like protein [Pseudomonas orientalis]|jgi:phage-related tail fiber protein|nr:phage-related tail fiber protein-like protein [Pseudomonas orientalis]